MVIEGLKGGVFAEKQSHRLVGQQLKDFPGFKACVAIERFHRECCRVWGGSLCRSRVAMRKLRRDPESFLVYVFCLLVAGWAPLCNFLNGFLQSSVSICGSYML